MTIVNSSSSSASTQELKYSNFVSTIHYGGPKQPSYEDILDALARVRAKAKYWVAGKEICPNTGNKHLQCYYQFKNRERRSALVRIIPTFWERQAPKSKNQEARDYCTKDGDFEEGGVYEEDAPDVKQAAGRAAGGAANADRWRIAREILESGDRKRMKDLDDQIFVQFNGACNSIMKQNMPPPVDLDWTETPNLWLYGKSGCGKSKKAYTENPGAYRKACNKWWDGYNDQEVAIIDDFDKRHEMLVHHIKIWGDRYGHIAEIKGGAAQIRPKKIIITSNYAPEEIWSHESDLEPIRRRFKVINMSPLDGAFVPAAAVATFVGPTGTLPLSEDEDEEMADAADDAPVIDLTDV